MSDTLDKTGPVTHEEAKQIASRYNASHWYPNGKPGEQRARYTIPADPMRDDDIRLSAYIEQNKRRERQRDEAVGLLRRVRDAIYHETDNGPNYGQTCLDFGQEDLDAIDTLLSQLEAENDEGAKRE